MFIAFSCLGIPLSIKELLAAYKYDEFSSLINLIFPPACFKISTIILSCCSELSFKLKALIFPFKQAKTKKFAAVE